MPRGFGAGYVPRKRWLTPSEVSRLVAVLPADRAARVAFMVATGAEWRATERALDEDVWPDLSVVHIRGTKRESRDRLVPIVTAAQRCLLEIVLAKARGTDGHIFRPWSNVSRDLAAACASAGIERCSPNDLRRSFAHWLKEFNVSNEALAPAMGHTTTRMLERVYARLDVNEIRAAMLADIRASAQPA